jgi:acetyl esterase/lipase
MQIRINRNGCRYFLLAVIMLFSLSACSRASLLDVIIPHSGYTKYSNIAYGADLRQHVDIYIPTKMSKPPVTLLFFYGGSWQYGKKEDYRFVGQAFASQGFITVIADYRLYPSVYYPAFMDDTAKALVWVHEHIRSYGGDPNNIFVSGHSAGGFNAMMLTVNHQFLQRAGGKLSWIRGAIGLAGPYDFLPFTEPEVKALFSKVKDQDTQPINFVGPGLPPILLLTGDADTEVFPKNAIHMYHKLQKFNDPVELIIYPKIGHIDIVLSLAYGFRSKAATVEDISQFMRKHATR